MKNIIKCTKSWPDNTENPSVCVNKDYSKIQGTKWKLRDALIIYGAASKSKNACHHLQGDVQSDNEVES